ncbi:MAG: hypothetical protein QOK37_3800 [Thermoanaerobaculia bacterium]|jgi:hypothetical protein|nr:hypothetical protein [Thermoanaerobaculia bacterium]
MPRQLYLIIGLLLVSVSGANAATERDRIVITEKTDAFEMTVPVSGLVMSIPKGGFQQANDSRSDASASRRYFYLHDKESHVILSGWFESASEFAGITTFWDSEVAEWKKKGLPDPSNVTFTKVSRWEAITYQIQLPEASNSHIRAHWVQAGTWIDLHLSMTSQWP